ncbi:hypothetical protein BJ963_003315 [Leifsonia soli]|uniref:Uncharacterized protein n=1 Tax=Leifsonia soli TaxID=582665 RepID=A0A852T2D0_9MICO|nr:hypothetical protein [Leifsonia soli]
MVTSTRMVTLSPLGANSNSTESFCFCGECSKMAVRSPGPVIVPSVTRPSTGCWVSQAEAAAACAESVDHHFVARTNQSHATSVAGRFGPEAGAASRARTPGGGCAEAIHCCARTMAASSLGGVPPIPGTGPGIIFAGPGEGEAWACPVFAVAVPVGAWPHPVRARRATAPAATTASTPPTRTRIHTPGDIPTSGDILTSGRSKASVRRCRMLAPPKLGWRECPAARPIERSPIGHS